MKSYYFFVLTFLLACGEEEASSNENLPIIPSFELKAINQLNTTEVFDLSGITCWNTDSCFVVSDKQNIIYYLDQATFTPSIHRNLNISNKLDLEAIDHCNQNFYLAFETGRNQVVRILETDYRVLISKQSEKWKNKGIEAIALNCAENVLFFAKERQPAILFKADLNQKNPEVYSIYTKELTQNSKNDITDLKFSSGLDGNFLYILKRYERIVQRINLETGAIFARSFAEFTANAQGEHILYKVKQKERYYGLAEALLITNTEIWVGLDNNGKVINPEHPLTKLYKLKGSAPVFLRFGRGDF